MKIEVVPEKITVKLGDTSVKLTRDECWDLYHALEKELGIQILPTYPNNPWWIEIQNPPLNPYIIWSSDNTGSVDLDSHIKVNSIKSDAP